jgi:hypothetical protein
MMIATTASASACNLSLLLEALQLLFSGLVQQSTSEQHG